MNILGADVGKATGLCLLDFGGPRPRYVDSAAIEDNLPKVLIARFLGPHLVDAVGIEMPAQVFAHGRAKGDMGARIGIERNLIIAARQAGIVIGVSAFTATAPLICEAQAHEIRRAVLGKLPKKREDIDRLIARMVPVLIAGWPKRSNDHERDAAVAALWMREQIRFGRAR